MRKVNEINININRAVVKSISIDLTEDKVIWSVLGALLTKEGKEISTFSMTNNHWDDSKNIEVPLEANVYAKELFKAFMPILYKQINGEFKSLPDVKK
jgi:hypothetical protein